MQSSTTPAPTPPAGAPRTPSPFAPFELLLLAGRHKVLTLGLPLALGVLAYAASLLLPNEYRSTVAVVASDKTPSLLLKNTADSDPVRDAVIKRLQLAQRWGAEDGANVSMRYERRVTTRATRDAGVLSISAVDEDPKFAAGMAEAVARETIAAAHRELITASSLAIRKLQGRLQQAESARTATQERLAQAGGKDWRDALTPNESALMAAIGDLQAEINLQGIDPPQSRESSMLLLQERLSTLQQQFTDRNSVRNPATAGVLPMLKDQFYYASLTRRLGTQIEIAQKDMADEVRLAGPAPIPLVKDSPKRSQIALTAAVAGLLLGLLIGIGRERGGERMAALRRAWGRQPA